MAVRALAATAIIGVAAIGCGGTYGGKPRHDTAVKTVVDGPKTLEAAALPYQILDARTGHQVDSATFWQQLATMRAVCVGEEHPNPHHHWVQLEVVRHLAKSWTEMALGMEMFQRPFQGVLDDYAAKRISDDALRSRAGWEDRWGYDYWLYGPVIAAAVDAHAALLALNAAKELTKKVAHHGIESLTTDERAQVPDLKLDDTAHRAWFDDLMENMGGTTAHAKPKDSSNGPDEKHADPDAEMPSADRVYTVQVMWDETMADGAAKWLHKTPNGHVVILAGTGHCHDSAIVNRIKRRGIAEVVSLRSVVDDGLGGVAEALARPMNDYLVVLDLPADVKAKLKAEADKER